MMFILESPTLTIQTFPDHPNANGYPEIRCGPIDTLTPWFTERNQAGMGIFYAVNEMQPGHRDRAHTVRVNAYYADIDGMRNPLQKDYKAEELLTSPLPPCVIIYTKNGVQALWAVHSVPLDHARYKQTQLGVIRYFCGDENAKDIARVLRMPGTLHMKDPNDPYLCTVMYQDDEVVYTEEEVRAAFPPPRPRAFPGGNITHGDFGPIDPREWGELMREYHAWPGVPGRRHDTLLIAAGNAVRCRVPQTQAVNDLLPIVEAWRNDERLAETEVENAVEFAFSQGVPYSAAALRNRLK